MKSLPCARGGGGEAAGRAVSYTHLDVYKRQSFGMSHTLLKRTTPSILFSEHSVCILRSEISHLVAASCTVIYSNITNLHIISRYIILGQTNNSKKRIVSTTTQKNSGRDFSLPPLPYAKIIFLSTISLAHARMLLSRPVHSKAFSAFNCSIIPCACFICSTNRKNISSVCLSMSAR